MQWSDCSKKKKCQIFTLLCLLGCTIYLVSVTNEFYIAKLFERSESSGVYKSDRPKLNASSGFVVDTPGCRIPAMDPFDPLVKKFIEKVKPIDCAGNSSPQLVKSNLTSLYVDHSALAYYNVSDADHLECCYMPFWRIDGDMLDDELWKGSSCIYFQREVIVEIELVKVECQINGTEIYTDYHSFIPIKENIERQSEQTTTDSLSVLVIGIDSVSRLNFHRQMPLTDEFLREMGAIEMLGYNKVADNTFPNLVPVLSGLTEEELNTCWRSSEDSFDLCPWLWKNYSAAGYTTAFGEDAPWKDIFSYLKVKFVQLPTDYYMRPYTNTFGEHLTNKMSTQLCIGPRPTRDILLQYVSKFAQSMKYNQYFGIFWWGSLHSDKFNNLKSGDVIYERTLRQLAASGALNRTLLIVTSSHGAQLSTDLETYEFLLEERLPLLSFVFPVWFEDKYSGAITNLRRNAQRLTTPFDLHATLLDLLRLSTLEGESLTNRTDLNQSARAVSLFLPVSSNRTCTDAGILSDWCSCPQSQDLVVKTKIVKKMALVIVNHVNQLLKSYPTCVQLKLHTVHYARKVPLQNNENNATEDSEQYVLAVETNPGNALFEAKVRKWQLHNITVIDTVSRVNVYGNQSSCVKDLQITLYCFCDSYYYETL